MATQGLVTIKRRGWKVLLKVVAGCDGYNAQQVADAIEAEWPVDAARAYQIAIEHDFGCEDDLVVMSDRETVFEPVTGEGDLSRYREKFQEPTFNPRWKHGTADHVVVVELPPEPCEHDVVVGDGVGCALCSGAFQNDKIDGSRLG